MKQVRGSFKQGTQKLELNASSRILGTMIYATCEMDLVSSSRLGFDCAVTEQILSSNDGGLTPPFSVKYEFLVKLRMSMRGRDKGY